jgi:hypothetical protein
MKTTERVYVVFDGTSHYILSASDLQEMGQDKEELEIIDSYFNIMAADKACDKLNCQSNARFTWED